MTTLQINAQLPFKALLGSLQQLSDDELNEISRQTAIIKARQRVPSLSAVETTLLTKIYATTISDEVKARCHELTVKQRADSLTASEQSELANVIDEMEQINAARLAYLIELATLRGTDLDSLMQQLELTPLSYE